MAEWFSNVYHLRSHNIGQLFEKKAFQVGFDWEVYALRLSSYRHFCWHSCYFYIHDSLRKQRFQATPDFFITFSPTLPPVGNSWKYIERWNPNFVVGMRPFTLCINIMHQNCTDSSWAVVLRNPGCSATCIKPFDVRSLSGFHPIVVQALLPKAGVFIFPHSFAFRSANAFFAPYRFLVSFLLDLCRYRTWSMEIKVIDSVDHSQYLPLLVSHMIAACVLTELSSLVLVIFHNCERLNVRYQPCYDYRMVKKTVAKHYGLPVYGTLGRPY